MSAHTHIRRPSKTLSRSTYFDLKLCYEHSLKSLKDAFPFPLFLKLPFAYVMCAWMSGH